MWHEAPALVENRPWARGQRLVAEMQQRGPVEHSDTGRGGGHWRLSARPPTDPLSNPGPRPCRRRGHATPRAPASGSSCCPAGGAHEASCGLGPGGPSRPLRPTGSSQLTSFPPSARCLSGPMSGLRGDRGRGPAFRLLPADQAREALKLALWVGGGQWGTRAGLSSGPSYTCSGLPF